MAGGSLAVTVVDYAQAPSVAQRMLCWLSAANKPFLLTDRAASGTVTFRIAEERFGVGSLLLKRGGTDLVAGYVAGSNVSFTINNGGSIEQNVNTCPASTTQPTTTGASFVTNVGSNPLATTLTYANAVGAGTVNIFWGDGTSTLGAAESGSSNHTYPFAGATYQIRVVDATSAADVATFWVRVP
jgi:hypothetical protein